MPIEKLTPVLDAKLEEFAQSGRLKGSEAVTTGMVEPAAGKGPRFLIEGHGERPFLRMNSNSYMGLSFATRVMAVEEEAVRRYGVGPGAVRFISGTWAPHVKLEKRLAEFHGRIGELPDGNHEPCGRPPAQPENHEKRHGRARMTGPPPPGGELDRRIASHGTSGGWDGTRRRRRVLRCQSPRPRS